MIWQRVYTVDEINRYSAKTLLEHLNITFTHIGEDTLRATMPVDHRTIQPAGILHGGASVALAESVASVASYLTIDHNRYTTVGLEINANHIRAKKEGTVTGIARSVHLGRTTQVWEVKIVDETGKIISVSRITMLIREKF